MLNRPTRILLSFAAVGPLLALMPNDASASYLCEAAYISDKDFGTYGYLFVTLYNLPDCGGTYQGFRVWCSANATSSYCASDPDHLATTSLMLLEAWKIAVEAARTDAQVSTANTGTYAFKGLTVYAD